MTNQRITTKQEEILTLIYKYKFLNRIQIQSFLKHKDHRRINSWLKDLTENEYLKRIWSNGYVERTRPSIYYLALNSLDFLSKQYFITPKYFSNIAAEAGSGSSGHIADALLLADLSVSFLNKNNKAVNSSVITKTELAEPYSEYCFLIEAKIKPELIFTRKASNKGMTKYYLLEVTERYASFILVRNKIKRYFDLNYSNDWEDNTGAEFPTVLWVCHSMYLLIYAKRYARRLRADEYPDADFTIQFALLENLKSNESGSDVWEKA
jgi:hypothetical protein